MRAASERAASRVRANTMPWKASCVQGGGGYNSAEWVGFQPTELEW